MLFSAIFIFAGQYPNCGSLLLVFSDSVVVESDTSGCFGCVLHGEAEFLLDKCASGIGKTDAYIILVFGFIVERINGHQFATLDGKGCVVIISAACN